MNFKFGDLVTYDGTDDGLDVVFPYGETALGFVVKHDCPWVTVCLTTKRGVHLRQLVEPDSLTLRLV